MKTSWDSNLNSTEVNYIKDSTIIQAITNEDNWQGNFIGTLPMNMPTGSKYIDVKNGYIYEFDGTNLVRYIINNLNL